MKLAELCSRAVDYPKNGVLVNIDEAPRTLIPFKPDWREAEVVNPHHADFYPSTRALGYLYRAIKIEDKLVEPSSQSHQRPLSDPISKRLYPKVQAIISDCGIPDGSDPEIGKIFQSYADELDYIRFTHSISTPDPLTEEEVVVGTILAKCSQKRWRSDRMHSMRTNVSALTRDIQSRLLPAGATPDEARRSLMKAWAAWDYCIRHRKQFGANSFGIIALAVLFDCFAKLGVVFTN
jgi:RNA-dependent RNA polymerase